MKNLAGHPVSIFLFRFVLSKTGIRYVLNESIAEDMYPEIEEAIRPLVHACSETLLRYRQHCTGDTIMDGSILTDGCFEVMLSKGLGSYFHEVEKQNLFNDAHTIGELLMDVMERRTLEMEQGTYPGPQKPLSKIGPAGGMLPAYELLGEIQRLLDDALFKKEISPPVKKRRLKPEDLPAGVTAKASYDHRGKCVAFEHVTLGGLGKIVLVDQGPHQTVMESELFRENRTTVAERKSVFDEVIKVLANHLNASVAPKR